MRILVTGCAGFIGREVIRQLAELYGPAQLWGLDLDTDAAINWDEVEGLLGAQLVHGDVTSDRIVRRLLARARPAVVLHLAAQSHVDASLEDPTGTMFTNAVGTQVVAHACAEAGIPLVYCSTDEVYGDAWEDGQPLRPRVESDPLLPSSPYSAGKAAGEMAVRAAARSLGLRYAITRGCNAYGPGQGGDKLVPIACELLQRGEPVPLHGGGDQVRQWIHVEEFAEMLIGVGVALERGDIEDETYNLSGPTRCSVLTLVEELGRSLGIGSGNWREVADRPGQDRAYAIDGGKLWNDIEIGASRDILAPDELLELLEHYKGRRAAAPAIYAATAAGGVRDARV